MLKFLYYVLITLEIIGVVATLTLPSLVNEIQDRQFIFTHIKDIGSKCKSLSGDFDGYCAKNVESSPMFGSFTYANGSGLAGAGCNSEYLYK